MFNALSMSFPAGEQLFIDSVRKGLKELPPDTQEKFAKEVQGFVGQEATHRRIHSLFNAQVEKHGYVNEWDGRARAFQAGLEEANVNVRHWLAITAANEHFTAILAEWMLSHTRWFDGVDDRIAAMWFWHSAEESEHKSTAFDLYLALGGNEEWRQEWLRRVTFGLLNDLRRQTLANLKKDGVLWKFSTWASAFHFLLGKHGLFRCGYRSWKAYKQAGFHPNQQTSALAADWLRANSHRFKVVNSG